MSTFYDIANNTLDAVNDPGFKSNTDSYFGTNLITLQSNLNSLKTKLDSGNVTLQDAQSRQTEINTIILSESERIGNQSQSLLNAKQGKQRIINLNDSYRKRYIQYLKIIIAITITLTGVWIIKILDERFGSLLPIYLFYLFDILTILVVSVGIIYCYIVYSDIGRHNTLNYDELNLAPPPNSKIETSGNALPTSNTGVNGEDLLSGKGCSGQACCSVGTQWNIEKRQCVATPSVAASAFTTMQQAGVVKPFSESEVNDYGNYHQ